MLRSLLWLERSLGLCPNKLCTQEMDTCVEDIYVKDIVVGKYLAKKITMGFKFLAFSLL